MTTLFDTGPLVAAIDRSDKHHARCAAFPDGLTGPRLIPATVMTEVCWPLEERPGIEAAFPGAIAAAESGLTPLTSADLTRMAELVRGYASLPLGTADASVIAIAERLNLPEVAAPRPPALHHRPPPPRPRPHPPALTPGDPPLPAAGLPPSPAAWHDRHPGTAP